MRYVFQKISITTNTCSANQQSKIIYEKCNNSLSLSFSLVKKKQWKWYFDLTQVLSEINLYNLDKITYFSVFVIKLGAFWSDG